MSWNDAGFLKTWGEKQSLYFAPINKIAYDLISAYNERADKVGLEQLSLDPFQPDIAEITAFEPTYNNLPELDIRIETLINAGWADISVNNGNYEGLSEFPLLSIDRILEIIGDDEWLTFDSGGSGLIASTKFFSPVTVEWVWQKYRALNLLVWSVDRTPTVENTTGDWYLRESRVSWADCVSNFKSDPQIISFASIGLAGHTGMYISRSSIDTWYIGRSQNISGEIISKSNKIHAFDAYSMVFKRGSFDQLGNIFNVYENNDFDANENTLILLSSDDEQSVDRHQVNSFDFNASSVTVSEPQSPLPTGEEDSSGYAYFVFPSDAVPSPIDITNWYVFKWDNSLEFIN